MPRVLVQDLRPGDMIDLEGDAYADPDRDHPEFECEYALVAEVEVETPDCVCVYFEGHNPIGFPMNWKIRYCGHDSEYEAE